MRPGDDGLRTVQVRTTAVATGTATVLLAVGAVWLVAAFERQQVEQVDRRLAASANTVESVASGAEISAIPPGAADDALVQVVDIDGTVLYSAARLDRQPAMISVDEAESSTPQPASPRSIGPVRVVAIPLGNNSLLLAESLQGVDDAVTDLTSALLIGLPALVAVLGALVWLVVGRTLRPAREAMARERRLVADVSHELRTPLAGARALLESESQIPAEIELNRLEALAALSRLEALTEDLLVDARSGTGPPLGPGILVDLDDVVLRVVDRAPSPRTLDPDVSGVSAGQVRGDERDLERMVSNLLANAIRHARTTVRIGLTQIADAVVLTISDDGPGIAPEDRERIFERFTRLDDARTRDGAGAGLGLPIARSIALANRGAIDVRDSAMGGAAFVVTLPSAASSETRSSTASVTSRPI